MSENFWETNLSPGDEVDEQQKRSASTGTKIRVTLDDFPVSNWDSDNDGNHIVWWYNQNRGEGSRKTLDYFKSKSGVSQISTKADAQKILDSVITILQNDSVEDVTKPSYGNKSGSGTIDIHSPMSIGALFGGWLFTGIWCTVSFLAFIFIGGPVLADLGTADWTPTDGVVIDSGVDESTGGKGGVTYCLWVDYQYTFENRTYNGYVVSYSQEDSCNSWSEDADEKYPPGSDVTVYVNPDNPAEAVLENGFSGLDFAICCVFPFVIIGIIMLVSMLRSTFSTLKSNFV